MRYEKSCGMPGCCLFVCMNKAGGTDKRNVRMTSVMNKRGIRVCRILSKNVEIKMTENVEISMFSGLQTCCVCDKITEEHMF